MGRDEILASIAVVVLAGLLIGLIWVVTQRAVQDQQEDVRERAETMLSAQAATLAEEVRHELLMVDQTLTILQAAWSANSDSFKLSDWVKRVPALTAVADDIFIADDKQIISQDILPNAAGQGIGSAYVNFAHGSLELFESDGRRTRNSEVMIGETGQLTEARQFLMYVVRPLDHPKNWIIGASFRSATLTKLYGQAVLGINGVTALIDTRRGGVQALAGPVARRPRVDVSKTPMYAAMKERPDGGIWIGPSGMDGVERMHAYRRVAGRDMIVVVAMVQAQAMEPATAWATGAHSLAVLGTILVVAVAGLVLVALSTLRSTRRRRRAAERDRANAEATQADLQTTRARLALATAQVAALQLASADGIATFDGGLRLSGWNARFAASCGLAEDALTLGLPLDEMLRRQAHAGLFGPLADIEAEVARRVGILRVDGSGAGAPGPGLAEAGLAEAELAGAELADAELAGAGLVGAGLAGDDAALTQAGPDNATLELRATPLPDGGLLLLLGGPARDAVVEW